MCGIAGTVDCGTPELVAQMCDTMLHRGPDSGGSYSDGRANLGMRRLAIIDVAGGQQPVSNEDATIHAVFNGEIYNFAELRDDLRRRGHTLRTVGDSECLVHLYEEYGDDFVTRLRGMFAFAIWDQRRGRLLVGRDRLGKKPLYWRTDGTGIQFASEAKALLADPSCPRRLDQVAMHHYLSYQYVPAPWSIYEGIHKLPPGHLLVWHNGSTTQRSYWRLDFTPREVSDPAAAAEEIRERILEAVRIRLVGERPLGAFLSGGLDSAAVVAAMSLVGTRPVRTFTIGFEEASLDEREGARLVAAKYATDHHELVVTGCDAALLERLAWHYDEPFADSSAIPSYFVSQLARDHVTVVLNGDGGDECFGGYQRYQLMRWLGRVPRLHPAGLVDRATRAIAGRSASGTRLHRLGRAARMLTHPPAFRYGAFMVVFDRDQKQGLYTEDLRAALAPVYSLDLLEDAYNRSRASDIVGKIIDTDVNTYLPGDLLAKMDIATMANSIEARSPLLDHELMEWAAGLPTNLKVRHGTTKYLFKQAIAPWLPSELLNRPKRGFGVPLAAWLRGSLRDLAWGVLTDDTARQRGLFRPEAVVDLLKHHDEGYDVSTRLWTLIQFELWHRCFLDNPVRESVHAGTDHGLFP